MVTDADLNYEGSITIDAFLMEKTGILPNEMVHVFNISNGARIETYAIKGKAHSGTICMNGAAARLFQPGDLIIILATAWMDRHEAEGFEPVIMLVDKDNRPVSYLKE